MVLVAIDVDSTLHDYWQQFREAAALLHGVDLPYEQQTDWAVEALSRSQLLAVIEHTHDDARIAQAIPYEGAADVINAWRRLGHTVLITTHRRPGAHDVTAQWLGDHGIGYDLLRCGYEKVSHCQSVGAHVLIDDSPTNLAQALGAGLTPATIDHPWNVALTAREPEILSAPDWVRLAAVLGARHPELQLD